MSNSEQENLLEDLKSVTKIKQIIMINSASYQYFEAYMDKNLLMEANNNSGKTSILNALQFLILPEITLNNINSKFALKSGKDKKAYTAKQTYEYYFNRENSFIVYEIENKNKTFCVLIYGFKKTNHEYRRVIIDTEYSKIKHLFINDKQEISNLDRTTTFSQIKDISNNSFKELKTKDDIKKELFNGSASAEFSIVPLKDSLKGTIDNFSVLYKSFYDINSMGNTEKIKLISDIIKSKKSKSNEDELKFNIANTQEEYKRIDAKSKHLENLNNYQQYYDYIDDNLDITLSEDKLLKQETVQLYDYLNVEQKSIEKTINEKSEVVRDLEEKINSNNKNLDTIKESKYNNQSKLESIIKDLENIKSDYRFVTEKSSVPYNEMIINLNDMVKNREDISAKLTERKLIAQEAIERLQKTIQDKLDNKDLIERKNQLNKNILRLKSDIDLINRKESNIEKMLINSSKFTEEEKFKIQMIFNEEIRMLNIELLSDEEISAIKTILNSFETENGGLYKNKQQITFSSSIPEDEIELLRIKKEEMQILLMKEEQKYEEIKISDNNEQNLRDIEELKLNIEKREKEIITSNKIQKIYFNMEDLIKKLETLPNEEKYYLEQLEETNKQLEKLSENFETLRMRLDKLEEEIESEKKERARTFHNISKLDSNNIIDKAFEQYATLKDCFEAEIFQYPKLLTVIEEDKVKQLISKWNNYSTKLSMLEDNLNKLIKKGLLNSFSEDTKENIKLNEIDNEEGKYNFKKLYDYLKDEYSVLKEKEEENQLEKQNLSKETNISLNILHTAKRDIQNFEKEINKKFEEVKISNLKGVKIEFRLNKDLTSLIDKFHNKFKDINHDKLDYYENIMEINNYLMKHLDNKNEIDIESLIISVDYKIIKDFDIDTDGNRINEVLIETTQSNGTETMIMIILISMLLKGLYKKGSFLQLPILIDEIQNIDINNIKALLHNINQAGNIIVGATPSASADFRNEFNQTITLDALYSKKVLDNKQQLIVVHDSLYTMFKNEKIENKSA